MNKWLPLLKQDILFFFLIATVSVVIGIALNLFRDHPLDFAYRTKEQRIMKVVSQEAREKNVRTPVEQGAFPETMTVEELRTFVRDKRGLVLDARPEIFYRNGHIPMALSLPREDFENSYERLKAVLEKDRSQLIVVYCSAVFCQDSELVRKALVALGYSHVAVMSGGWAAWNGEGNDIEDQK